MGDTPYRLGRNEKTEDPRDWDSDKLHEKIIATTVLPDSALDKSVRDVAATLVTWKEVQAFASALWAWIKGHKKPVPPTPPPVPVTFKIWNDDLVLDQGNYGTCVGNTGAGWMRAEPVQDSSVNEDLARQLYYEATCNDGSCDNTYQQGATSRGLAQALVDRKRLIGYAYANSMADIDEWLDNHGPVMVGSNWTDDMFNPSPTGFVSPTGNVAGGHEYLMLGREAQDTYYFANSWGTGWADKGHFRMTRTDINDLIFKQGGDALLAAEQPL